MSIGKFFLIVAILVQSVALADVKTVTETPYLEEFVELSPTFAEYWKGCKKNSKFGSNTYWASLEEKVMMVLESFHRIIDNDYEWYNRRCGLTPDTFKKIRSVAEKISAKEKDRKLFYLEMYAVDFGRVVTNRGYGHEEAGIPIIEKIMKELEYDDATIESGKKLVRMHTMPGEIFLGEVSPNTVDRILFNYAFDKEPSFLQEWSFFNLLDINSISEEGGYLYEANALFIINFADWEYAEKFVCDGYKNRLYRIAVSTFPKRVDNKDKRRDIVRKTDKRVEEFEACIEKYSEEDRMKIERFLRVVDFHYTAAMFTKMSPKAMARFMKISSRSAFPGNGIYYSHMTSMNTMDATEFDNYLLSDDIADKQISDSCISIKGRSIVWDQNKILSNISCISRLLRG